MKCGLGGIVWSNEVSKTEPWSLGFEDFPQSTGLGHLRLQSMSSNSVIHGSIRWLRLAFTTSSPSCGIMCTLLQRSELVAEAGIA